MSSADPMLPAKAGEEHMNFLVDTGATYSTIINQPSASVLSTKTVSLMGFSGKEQCLPLTLPLPVKVGNQKLHHSFVWSPSTLVNLMGRDLLVKLGAAVLCGPQGLTVTFPDGSSLACGHTFQDGQYLVRPVGEEFADIYWGLLTEPAEAGVLSVFQLWKPWIQSLSSYLTPPDPPHVTLFYDRNHTEESFAAELESNAWTVTSKNIYVAPEGVAAAVMLTPEQHQWYMMSDEAFPHISLSLHSERQASELGGMVKRSLQTTDWAPTSVPGLLFSNSTKTYQIVCDVTDKVLLKHELLTRHHGRERTDHHKAAEMLDALPSQLWATSPTDVGLVSCAPVSFQVATDSPIWVNQYPHKPQAEEGIADTIAGLLTAGVLEPSVSAWNTPILPVEKKQTVWSPLSSGFTPYKLETGRSFPGPQRRPPGTADDLQSLTSKEYFSQLQAVLEAMGDLINYYNKHCPLPKAIIR
ncbi:uncharacterized protein LOC118564794 [Fundulus heteroclitus]|uniref:uncharacterized protein LOC118564794 n=1 Tax=Fundulus heteroclitus TaxID=8078 RepID=UPI00165B3790|nr:uncharacterized protein LOC118564794 [Fundulus heteroclitus]